MIYTQPLGRCPSCGSQIHLRSWRELTDEEQELVRKLPGTSFYPIAERVARHKWCTVCWHEDTNRAVENA